MPVMRLTSTKTLPILLLALEKMSFTQTELAQSTKTSIGRVNKVIAWLKEKDMVFKEQGKYHISQPNRLCDTIASEQSISKQRNYLVAISEEEIVKVAKEKKFVLCLQSAKRLFDKKIMKEKTNNASLVFSEELEQYLDSLPRGDHTITLFHYDSLSLDEKLPTINKIRTIIDLKTIGEQAESEELAQNVWRTRQ